MNSSTELWDNGDDLARQRRKRDARLLEQQVVGFPALTLGDVVAEVLAASDASHGTMDVAGYLAIDGHDGRTIEAVVGYLHRHHVPDEQHPPRLPLL
ncbi:MAG: hypothetical protein ACRD2C_24225 [Acidimicrobiales bacterium]